MEALTVADWLRDWLCGNPPKNVWLGVSVENQKCADERIPTLIETDAAIKFLSVEPMLGEIDLSYWLTEPILPNLQWVIVGGESGPASRAMQESWVQKIRVECEAANVPFFFKQWGGKLNKKGGDNAELNGKIWHELPTKSIHGGIPEKESRQNQGLHGELFQSEPGDDKAKAQSLA